MKLLTWILGGGLGSLLFVGCSNYTGTGEVKQSVAGHKLAEEAARAKRFKDLLGNGKTALEEKRFEQAVKDLEEAVRLQDDPQARELLQQARKGRDEARKAAYDQAILRGRQARKEKNYPAAAAAFRCALSQLPEDKEA